MLNRPSAQIWPVSLVLVINCISYWSRLLGNNEEMYDIEEGIRELSAATRNLARVRGLVELATASEQDTSERLLQTAATYRVSLSEYKLAVGRD
jgi:hypothetical protein